MTFLGKDGLKNQMKDGHWETPDYSEGHGRLKKGINMQVYSTTLCALMLTVYYRYLPTFKIKKHTASTNDFSDEQDELIIE